MTVMLVVSFVLKSGGNDTFEFAKENYKQVFEKDNFAESTFSYKTFIEEMSEIPISIARGFARFEPEQDLHFNDVFKRADNAMYENKRKNKKVATV